MKKIYWFLGAALIVFALDQWIKWIILEGFRWESECISLILVYNKGVAFSMLSFLDDTLKYFQIVLLGSVLVYTLYDGKMFEEYHLPLGILIGAGVGNILDRFIHEGVVDYVYWHCGFDFAVFNFADVMIDVAIAIILYMNFFGSKKVKTGEEKEEI